MTDPLITLLEDLIQIRALSGHEAPMRERLRQAWEPLADEVTESRLGSLHAVKRGSGPEPRPTALLAAHMDAIGLMVSQIEDGLLRVVEVGGLDARVLPGQPVTVHGRRDTPGLIVQPPAACLPETAREGPVALRYLMVDTGLPFEEVRRRVRPGDRISFAQSPIQLEGDLLVGPSLDNRASLGALTVCLQELQGRDHKWDVIAAATVQEEETMAGAITSAFALRPTIAIAVDVTFGSAPGLPEHKTFPLGEGPVNGWGPDIHPAVHHALKEAAQRIEISLQDEYLPMRSGTDAAALQTAAAGVPTAVLSIPLRYMHTPVEIVSPADVRRAGRVLAELAAGLEPDFLERWTWD
jgi:endoglucanase